MLDIFQINHDIFVENSFSICQFGEKDDILSREHPFACTLLWAEKQSAMNEWVNEWWAIRLKPQIKQMGKPAGPKVIFHSDSALLSDTVECRLT